jgi:hypothetical protein
MDLHEVGCGGMDWIDLAQDRERWWTLVNVLYEPSGSIKCREFRLGENWLASQEGLCCME